LLKQEFHWCFSFEKEEKRILKAKQLWNPPIISKLIKVESNTEIHDFVEEYLR